MKIRYASDIHLEFSGFPVDKKSAAPEIVTDPDEILLVAGDTIPTIFLQERRTDPIAMKSKARFVAFLEAVKGFKKVYLISGNHEHYAYGDVATSKDSLNKFLVERGFDNIIALENDRVPLTDKVDLLACTLWTDMNKDNPTIHDYVGRGMNDFYMCNYRGAPFTTHHAHEIHCQSKKWLETQLDDDKQFVVMTHHCPSLKSIDPQYKKDNLNYGYASDLDKLVNANPHISHWVHGHTHFNVDYYISKTHILGHMRGYPTHIGLANPNYREFKLDKWFDI